MEIGFDFIPIFSEDELKRCQTRLSSIFLAYEKDPLLDCQILDWKSIPNRPLYMARALQICGKLVQKLILKYPHDPLLQDFKISFLPFQSICDFPKYDNFLTLIKKKYKNDPLFLETEERLIFNLGEREKPYLWKNPLFQRRFSAQITIPGISLYIIQVYNLAEAIFEERAHFWSRGNQTDHSAGTNLQHPFYSWKDVFEAGALSFLERLEKKINCDQLKQKRWWKKIQRKEKELLRISLPQKKRKI